MGIVAKVKRIPKILLVALIALVVVVAYLATAGWLVPADPIDGPAEDPMDQERGPIAWYNLYCYIGLDNEIGGYDADILEFTPKVYYYGGADQLTTIKERWTLDLLGFLTEDRITTELKVTITGPGKYVATWTPDTIDVELGEIGFKYVSFQSGNGDLWDHGTYACQVQVYLYGDEYNGLSATGLYTFTV